MENMKNIFLLLVLVLGISSSVYSQDDKDKKSFDLSDFKKNRALFLKKELNLTDAEAKAFIPLTEELMDKKFELNRKVWDESRDLYKKRDKTDADYEKLIDNWLDIQLKEAQLQKEYYTKFKKVLPPEKVYKYRKAEMKFNRDELGKYQHSHGSSNKKHGKR